MSETLILQLATALQLGTAMTGEPSSAEGAEPCSARVGAVSWVLVRDNAVAASGRLDGPEGLAALAETHGEVDRILAVVPGTDVGVHRATVPSRREGEARTAAPFVIEDDLAVDPEDVHVALGPANETGARLLLVADHGRMAVWRQALAPFAGLPVDLVPETLAFPCADEGAVLVDRGAHVLVLAGASKAVAVDTDLLPLLLPGLLEGVPPSSPLCVYGQDPAALIGEGASGRTLVAEAALDDTAFLARCADPARASVSLLQGPYKLRGRWTVQPALWGRAAALAACAVLVLVGIEASEAARLSARADRLHRQTEAVFREAFPDVRRIVNPRAQMKSRLKDLGAGSADPFLSLTAVLFRGLEALPAVEIRDLRYYAERGELGVSVTYQDYGDLERLKAAVTGAGGRFSEGGSRQQGGRIVGDVTIGLLR
ncbi:MAG: type II secretion system protein GspL [Alphaproteobacteria bacterium]